MSKLQQIECDPNKQQKQNSTDIEILKPTSRKGLITFANGLRIQSVQDGDQPGIFDATETVFEL